MADKVAVVTGASGGIGAELCKKLGADGWCVALAARREDELKKVAALCGGKTLVVKADVTRRAEVDKLLESALEKFGRVDLWVNNAGQGINRSVMELSDEDFDGIMAVNVKSAIYGIQAVVPYFQKQGTGHLVNVSSFLGRVPFVGNRSAYNAAKAALNSLTANLRMDLRRSHPGVKVSLVMPGVVLTDFAKNALHAAPAVPFTASSRMNPQTPQEVADIMMDLVRNPKPEVYTNPSSPESAKAYYADVAAFEDNMFRG